MDDKFGVRLRSLRKQAGLSQTAFARRLGTSLPTIHRLETRGRYPHDDIIQGLMREFDADPRWLLTGESEAGRALGIPVFESLDGDASLVGRIQLPEVPDKGKAVQVTGDDLLPTIRDGDYAIYVGALPDEGDIVLYRTEWGDARTRRFNPKEGGLLVAEHPDYPPIRSDDVKILGRVVQVIRHLRVASP